MKILVTGASGNVGTALRRRLAAEDVDVLALARRTPRDGAAPAGATWHSLDLGQRDAAERLAPLLDGVDAVVHCAWRIQPSHDEAALRDVNLGGSAAVLEAMTGATTADGSPLHLVVVSSVGTYAAGPTDADGRKEEVDESWPTTGIGTSLYSRQKAEVERMIDAAQAREGSPTVTRVRPGLVLQGDAGAEIARYFLGPLVPVSPLLRGVRAAGPPALPLPREMQVPVVHADDLADALWRSARERLVGGVNVAAHDHLDADNLARAFGARRSTGLPVAVLRAAAGLTWRLRLQPTDPGWVDLAARTPLLSTDRARTDLGWEPRTSAVEALEQLLSGMVDGGGAATPPLRARTATSGRMAP